MTTLLEAHQFFLAMVAHSREIAGRQVLVRDPSNGSLYHVELPKYGPDEERHGPIILNVRPQMPGRSRT